MCNLNAWNSFVHSFNVNPLYPLVPIFHVGSQSISFADAMHWLPHSVHILLAGIVIDGLTQISGDSGKGYTFVQETFRVGIYVGEGQISSLAGATLAGVDAIPGAITGPGDVIIMGGSYIVGSAATSFWLNQANGAFIQYVPSASDYIPYEPLPDWLINK